MLLWCAVFVLAFAAEYLGAKWGNEHHWAIYRMQWAPAHRRAFGLAIIAWVDYIAADRMNVLSAAMVGTVLASHAATEVAIRDRRIDHRVQKKKRKDRKEQRKIAAALVKTDPLP